MGKVKKSITLNVYEDRGTERVSGTIFDGKSMKGFSVPLKSKKKKKW